MAVEFRYATLDEYPQVSSFIDQHWSSGHVYTRMRKLFDWTFHREGHWDPATYSVSLAMNGGELVGILGGIPFTFNRFGIASKAVWIVNYVVRADHRKGATALQLLSSFRRAEFAAVVAFGINPATVTIYQVLRGKVLPEIPRHFLIMPGQSARMVRILQTAYPEWTVNRANELVLAFQLEGTRIAPSQVGHSIPASWDDRDWPELASQTMGASRDGDYLAWRYQRHPVFEYRIVTVNDGLRTGLAIWRLETIRRATPGGREDLDSIARLVEFLPTSSENAGPLFAALVKEVESAGAMAIDYYGYHGDTNKSLQDLGFRDVECHVDGKAIPARFQPLDGKGGGILSAIFMQGNETPHANGSECPWLWTKSDSDQDRPN